MKNLEAHFKEIKKQYPKTMSKDQLYRVAHISKATALYLLQSGAIPCKDTGKKTRRYTIKTDDVIEYLRQREICPEKYKASEGWYAGTAGAKKAIAPSCWITLTPEQTKQFELFFEAEMKEMADLITIEELAVFAGSAPPPRSWAFPKSSLPGIWRKRSICSGTRTASSFPVRSKRAPVCFW